MPMINAVKPYVEKGIYHIYSRSNNGEPVFRSSKHYGMFIEMLERYLLKDAVNNFSNRKVKNYSESINLYGFNILDNHYHLLVEQSQERVIEHFMRSLNVSLTYYLNKYNKSFGRIFQSVYKARLIENDYDLINISSYINLNYNPENPIEAIKYPYSSAYNYVDNNRIYHHKFVKESKILSYFGESRKSYKKFLIDTGLTRMYPPEHNFYSH